MGGKAGRGRGPPPEANPRRDAPVRQPPGTRHTIHPLGAPTLSLFNFASLLKGIFSARSTRGQQRRSRYRATLQIVHLEDRLVPAVTNITPGHIGTFATIQEAVNAASPGDTILADPGTFSEHVTINKSLVLEGAQHGVDARARSGAESIVDGGG